MLKFFRNIRNSLIQSSSGKYFLYAIGEILLVVIGILIALQINNWNEIRKKRVQERFILERIKADLSSDLDLITYQIEKATTFTEQLSILYGLYASLYARLLLELSLLRRSSS